MADEVLDSKVVEGVYAGWVTWVTDEYDSLLSESLAPGRPENGMYPGGVTWVDGGDNGR